MSEIKKKTRIRRYISEEDKKKHFIDYTNKCVSIINRQYMKIGKQSTSRTSIYTSEQIEKLCSYLYQETDKLRQTLLRKVEEKQIFNIGE